MEHGISGKIANAFIKSKLSILLVFAFLLLGLFSIDFIPREEDPQIEVPTADSMLGYQGSGTCLVHIYERNGHAHSTILRWRRLRKVFSKIV